MRRPPRTTRRASRSGCIPLVAVVPDDADHAGRARRATTTRSCASFQAKYTSVPRPGLEPDPLRLLARLGLEREGRARPRDPAWTRNYYHYPGPWIGAKPGFMNGGGFPMRFADLDGTPIDVYQAEHEHDRRVDHELSRRRSTRCSTTRSAPLGYYGVFGANMHTDDDGAAPGRRGDRRLRAGPQRAGDLVQAAARLGRRPQQLDDPRPQLERRHAHLRRRPSARARTACRRCSRSRARPGR